MSQDDHILISLESRHAENILAGKKVVELRRRAMKIDAGATIWIYAKLPVGSIIGRAKVSAVHFESPLMLWRKFGAVSGLSKTEFFDYFDGVPQGTAVELTESRRLDCSFSLASLRRFNARFQPPQFFARLKLGTPLLTAISRPT
jgi:predicted transcriptional regulator